jgi:putative transposase
VPTRWGNAGRLNLLGTLSLWATEETLEYHLLEGNCHKSDVIAYLDALAKQAERTATFTVVVLDNATFHRAKDVQAKRDSWEAHGLYLRYLPSYCPQFNLIEGVWRRLKGFLMPRRYYNSLADLKEALLAALALLNAVNLQI